MPQALGLGSGDRAGDAAHGKKCGWWWVVQAVAAASLSVTW
jgi:hypothetical protein